MRFNLLQVCPSAPLFHLLYYLFLLLTNKKTTANTLKEFKRCLAKFDTDKRHKMNFEPILATTKTEILGTTSNDCKLPECVR